MCKYNIQHCMHVCACVRMSTSQHNSQDLGCEFGYPPEPMDRLFLSSFHHDLLVLEITCHSHVSAFPLGYLISTWHTYSLITTWFPSSSFKITFFTLKGFPFPCTSGREVLFTSYAFVHYVMLCIMCSCCVTQ